MKKFLPYVMALWVCQSAMAADAAQGMPAVKVFGIEEREMVANCFYLEYPASYQVDPKSGIGVKNASIDKIEEGDLHTLILHDPSGGLEVRASAYGFISDVYVEQGIKSPREVILIDYLNNALTVAVSERDGMEIFRVDDGKETTVLFVRKNAEWGQCFQSLCFLLKDKEKYGDFEKEIEGMIRSFVPWFARK